MARNPEPSPTPAARHLLNKQTTMIMCRVKRLPTMKHLVIAAAVLGLVFSGATPLASAADKNKDKDEDSQGYERKHVPPGLEKKGGLPPGQAKKQGKKNKGGGREGEEESAPTPDAKPAPSAAPAAPAPSAPPVAPTPTVDPPKPAAPQPPVATAPQAPPVAAPKTPELPKPVAPAKPQPDPKEVMLKRTQLDLKVTGLNKAGTKAAEEAAILQRSAKVLNIPVKTLQAQAKGHPNMGPGGIYIANAIAKSSKVPFEKILDQHRQSKSWGAVAYENHVDLEGLLRDTATVEKGFTN